MTTQIILTSILAILIVAAAYYYLNWKTLLWLGGLFLTASLISLFLHYQNDNISLAIPVGGDLFRHGDTVSILGEYRWVALIGLLAGVVLMIAGTVKRIRMPSPQKSVVADEKKKPLTEKERIGQVMTEEIQKMQDELDDPVERGKKDAQTPGGVIPGHHANEPMGFESAVRDKYQTCGTAFVRDTVDRLKKEIQTALDRLAALKNKLSEEYYEKKAIAAYRDTAEEPDPTRVARLRGDVTNADKNYSEFIEALALRQGTQPEWDKPTPLKQLIVLGSIAAVVEYVLSYIFLKDQIGSEYALLVVAMAVGVVFIMAFLSAAAFRFMRRPHSMPKRVIASIGFVASMSLFVLGMGLLLEYRSIATGDAFAGVSEAFKTVGDGYISILNDINNLMLFLVNLIAFVLLYCKFLLWFEKFSGYRRVKKERDDAQQKWDAMFEQNSNMIKNALNETSDEAKEDRGAVAQAVNDLRDKKPVLENIKTALATSLQKLRAEYQDMVNEYRRSNATNRNVSVNPSPGYFNDDPPFNTVEEHFVGEYGIDEFLEQYREAIGQADDLRKKIDTAVNNWPDKRAELGVQWAREFEQKIQRPQNQ